MSTECLGAMRSNGSVETVYDAPNGLNYDRALGAWVRGWTHLEGRSAVLRSKSVHCEDISLLLYKEKY